MNTENFLNVAKDLARKAGDLCLELQSNLGDVRYKSVKDVVTIADVSSEKLIVEGLRAAFPTHSIRESSLSPAATTTAGLPLSGCATVTSSV